MLESLGVSSHFDAVLTSREAGAAKPDAAIFERARALTGLTGVTGDSASGVGAASRAIHVGDSYARDVEGAHAAGFEAVLVAPSDGAGAPARPAAGQVPHTRVRDLRGFADHVIGAG